MTQPGSPRFAVTSRDGVSVNERFHRAEDLLVFEVAGEEVRFLERRPAPPAVPGSAPGERVALIAPALQDCAGVVSLGFQGGARKALIGQGFALWERRGQIDAVLRDIVSRAAGSAETKGPTR